jgi:hypothetical protein
MDALDVCPTYTYIQYVETLDVYLMCTYAITHLTCDPHILTYSPSKHLMCTSYVPTHLMCVPYVLTYDQSIHLMHVHMHLHTINEYTWCVSTYTYVQSINTLDVYLICTCTLGVCPICTYMQPIDTLDACLTCTYIQSMDALNVPPIHTNHQVCFMHYYLVWTFACTHIHHIAHGLTYQCTDCLAVLTGVIVQYKVAA